MSPGVDDQEYQGFRKKKSKYQRNKWGVLKVKQVGGRRGKIINTVVVNTNIPPVVEMDQIVHWKRLCFL